MTEEQVKFMVDRFLGWKLPEEFNPDGGISFKKYFNEHLPSPMKSEPSGTNLFNYEQAMAMVKYMIDGVPHECQKSKPDATPREWWIEKRRRLRRHAGDTKLFISKSKKVPTEDTLEQIHVIEKSAFLLENQKRNEAVELCSKMEEERDALAKRVAELESRVLDYEKQVRDSVLSGRDNETFKKIAKELAAAKADLNRLVYELDKSRADHVGKLNEANARIAEQYQLICEQDLREQKLVSALRDVESYGTMSPEEAPEIIHEMLRLVREALKANKGGA